MNKIENIYDKARLTIDYNNLKRYMVEELNYSEKNAVATIRDIRDMDPEILHAFITWFKSEDDIKIGTLCGVDYEHLLEYRNLNPIAGFLAIDWYKKEPEEAYSMLSIPMKDKDNLVADADSINRNMSLLGITPQNVVEDDTGEIADKIDE